nr:transposase [Okeania hirsuta]
MFSNNIDYFKSQPVNIPKITILLDNGYHPQKIMEELKKVAPAILTNIPLKLSPKPLKAQKNQQGKTGFVPVTARWVIERTNSWMERCKSLVKNVVCAAFGRKTTLAHGATKINVCFVRLMLKRLVAIA